MTPLTGGVDLSRISREAPTPAPRSQGTAARVKEVLGLNIPMPASAAQRDKARASLQKARLPELAPPADFMLAVPPSFSNSSSGANRANQRAEQLGLPKTSVEISAERRAIPQSIIERTPVQPSMDKGSTRKRTPAKDFIPGLTLSAQMNIDTQRAEQKEQRSESGNTPQGSSGITKTQGIAGTVQLPPGVRPNIPSLTQVAATLPGGSNSKAVPGFTYAGQEAAKQVTKALNASNNILEQRAEQLATRRPTPQAKVKSGAPASKGQNTTKGKTKNLPYVPLPSINLESIATQAQPVTTGKGKGKAGKPTAATAPAQAQPNVFESIARDLFKSAAKAVSYEKRPLTSKVQAYADQGMSPSEAYNAANHAAVEKAIANAKDPEAARRLNENLGNI